MSVLTSDGKYRTSTSSSMVWVNGMKNAELKTGTKFAAEEAFVKAGHGVNHKKVMYNDFVIVGPVTDPSGIIGSENVST